jgi:hypothetical protein
VAVRADPEPGIVHEPQRERARPLLLVRAEAEIPCESGPERREAGAEREQALELLPLLRRPEALVVEVLATACGILPRRLELRTGVRRDPDVGPRRWDDEAADPLERVPVRYRPPTGVDVTKPSLPEPAPAASPCHRREGTPPTAAGNALAFRGLR